MAGEKPTGGYILSLLGGISIMIGGLFVIFSRSVVEPPFGIPDYTAFICGPIGILLGFIMIYGASQAYYNPSLGPRWGSVIIIISILSWVVAVGGVLVGFLFGFFGGILFIAWKPPKEAAPPKEIIIREREIVRIPCQYCQQLVDVTAVKCPFCGAAPR